MRVKLARPGGAGTMTHQEYVAALNRAVLRSELPVAPSSLTPPRFRIVPGPPLAAGHTSRCEYVDFEMLRPMSASEFGRRLAQALPSGIEVLWQRRLPPGSPHLMASLRSFSYEIPGAFNPDCARAFRSAAQWPTTRRRAKKDQTFDLKRSVTKLEVHPHGVSMRISIQPEGTPKPEDVMVSIFGLTPEEAHRLPMERAAIALAPAANTPHLHREHP